MVGRIRLFDTSGENEYLGIKVESPTEDALKTWFESDLLDCAGADPLIVYWCGHGAISLAAERSRHLFFSDSSKLNWRNLKWESVLQRLDSSVSPIRRLVVIVDACAESLAGTYWPDGRIVGAPPRVLSRLPLVAVFSARVGDRAEIVETMPLYTQILLKHLRDDSANRDFIELIREAHSSTCIDLNEELEKLAASVGREPGPLIGQLPFRIDYDGSDATRSFIPQLDSSIKFAVDAAKQKAQYFKMFGDEYAPSKSERARLDRFRTEIIADEDLEAWWARGIQIDVKRRRKSLLFGIAGCLVFAIVLLIGVFLSLDAKGAELTDALRDDERVLHVLDGYSWPVKWIARRRLRTVALREIEDRDRNSRISKAQHRASCAIALFHLGDEEYLDIVLQGPLVGDSYDPQSRTFAVLQAVSPGGLPASALLRRLAGNPTNSRTRQGLILALGQDQVMKPADTSFLRDQFRSLLLELFENDQDPGVHAAAWWCLLRKFPDVATQDELLRIAERLRGRGVNRIENWDGRQWYVEGETGLTMVVLPCAGQMSIFGSRDVVKGDSTWPEPSSHSIAILGSFSIAMTEANESHFSGQVDAQMSVSPAKGGIGWREACALCGQVFRLPNEIEWEYASRGGSFAAYSFGDNIAQLRNYASVGGPRDVLPPKMLGKMPNDFGLFDVHGGVAEWCGNDAVPFPPDQVNETTTSVEAVFRGGDGVSPQPPQQTSYFRSRYSKVLPGFPLLGLRPVLTCDAR